MFAFSQLSAKGIKDTAERKVYRLPIIGLGAGFMSFTGDIGKESNQSILNRFQPGYSLSIEQRVLPFLGFSLNGNYGKLSASNQKTTDRLNFKSTIIQADVNAIFHFDNGWIMKKDEPFAPFVSVGFGYLKFDPYGDLKDKNNRKYYYWKNGEIRDLPQADSNLLKSVLLKRDYKFETQLKDSLENYSRSTYVIPISAGFSLELSDYIGFDVAATYHFCMTDRIDNVKKGNNDAYWYFQTGLRLNLGDFKRDKDNRNEGVDFTELEKADSDGDGVKDYADLCPGTEKGIKVDVHGCEADNDKDGVPNHLDIEPNTKRGSLVDTRGKTMTDEEIEKRSADTLAATHEDAIRLEMIAKDKELMNGTLKSKSIPQEFQFADFNKDGVITSEEIRNAIDQLFKGGDNANTEKINRLIDYFFEQ